jgi:hypothetical protein
VGRRRSVYHLKARGRETGGAFALIEALVPPGGGPPSHIHRWEDEACYVLDAMEQKTCLRTLEPPDVR